MLIVSHPVYYFINIALATSSPSHHFSLLSYLVLIASQQTSKRILLNIAILSSSPPAVVRGDIHDREVLGSSEASKLLRECLGQLHLDPGTFLNRFISFYVLAVYPGHVLYPDDRDVLATLGTISGCVVALEAPALPGTSSGGGVCYC
jgi:hypothetical protein